MPKRAKELKPVQVQRLTAAGRYAVGGVPGLCLQVQEPNAEKGSNRTARTWILRAVVGDKRRDIGLGGFPLVSLAEARQKAKTMRDEIEKGVDPVAAKRAAKSDLLKAQASAMTFEKAATQYIEDHREGWRNAKHADQWASTLETYAYPVMKSLFVRDIDLPHVLQVLRPIWTTKHETASRVRGRIESVLDWATSRKYRTGENPARWKGNLDTQLPKTAKIANVKHHSALDLNAAQGFLSALRAQQGTGARALEFTILTAARSGEVRGAEWSEIDIAAKMWKVPAERMKANKEHRVPLSDAAIKLLKATDRVAGTDLVFPAPRGGQLSDMTLSAVLKRMQVDAVPHGFRSTFRDWAAERTNYPSEMAEMALAHTIGDKVEAAYRRGDLFEKRRQMMNDWAAFCAKPAGKASVTPITKKRA